MSSAAAARRGRITSSIESPYTELFTSDNIHDWKAAPAPTDPECFDPFCDYDHPVRVRFEDVAAAAFRVKGGVVYTPCERSELSDDVGADVYLKKEFLQHTGSFKERGARNSLLMLTPEERKRGAIAASAGNHASAISYHAKCLGIPATVVMPLVAPLMKIQLCKSFGSEVIVKGNDMGEAKRYALKYGKRKGMKYINGYDHPDILAGQGTCGLEILEQMTASVREGQNPVDVVCVAVGGGGLVAGVALAIKTLAPHVKIFACESERSQGWHAAMEAGKPVFSPVYSTLADGLAVPVVGCNSFATAAPLIDGTIVVPEEYIALAVVRLIEREKSILEGAGATSLAAILSGQLKEHLKPGPNGVRKRAVAILSGGNIDTSTLGRVIERGLSADGRLIQFSLTISDRPGGSADLAKHIGDAGGSIHDFFHDRAFGHQSQNDIYRTSVRVVVETADEDHARYIENVLSKHYKDVERGDPHAAPVVKPKD